MTAPNELGAMAATEAIVLGTLTNEELTEACLARIAESGSKNIIDTADMPTCYGSPIYAGHRPAWDAACIAACRAAGAVILGKTLTSEFAYFHPGKTRNPHNPEHTPGGSSSGSAAAVADGMALLAFGSQTAGSAIRPASFCGVVGTRVRTACSASLGSRGSRSRWILWTCSPAASPMSPSCTARCWVLRANMRRRQGRRASALCRTPESSAAGADVQDAVEESARVLAQAGATVAEVELPAPFRQARRGWSGATPYRLSRCAAARDRLPSGRGRAL